MRITRRRIRKFCFTILWAIPILRNFERFSRTKSLQVELNGSDEVQIASWNWLFWVMSPKRRKALVWSLSTLRGFPQLAILKMLHQLLIKAVSILKRNQINSKIRVVLLRTPQKLISGTFIMLEMPSSWACLNGMNEM